MEEFPIYDAAVYGEYETVIEMLEDGPELVNAVDKYGFTPLHGVASEGPVEMARLLIERGASIHARNDEGLTPIHLAVLPEMIELLVEKGADINVLSDRGNTPLHIMAGDLGRLEGMEKLLAMGAIPDVKNQAGDTPMDFAAMHGDEDAMELLRRYVPAMQGEP